MDEDMRMAIQMSKQEADKFGTNTNTAQDKMIGRPTKGGLNN